MKLPRFYFFGFLLLVDGRPQTETSDKVSMEDDSMPGTAWKELEEHGDKLQLFRKTLEDDKSYPIENPQGEVVDTVRRKRGFDGDLENGDLHRETNSSYGEEVAARNGKRARQPTSSNGNLLNQYTQISSEFSGNLQAPSAKYGGAADNVTLLHTLVAPRLGVLSQLTQVLSELSGKLSMLNKGHGLEEVFGGQPEYGGSSEGEITGSERINLKDGRESGSGGGSGSGENRGGGDGHECGSGSGNGGENEGCRCRGSCNNGGCCCGCCHDGQSETINVMFPVSISPEMISSLGNLLGSAFSGDSQTFFAGVDPERLANQFNFNFVMSYLQDTIFKDLHLRKSSKTSSS